MTLLLTLALISVSILVSGILAANDRHRTSARQSDPTSLDECLNFDDSLFSRTNGLDGFNEGMEKLIECQIQFITTPYVGYPVLGNGIIPNLENSLHKHNVPVAQLQKVWEKSPYLLEWIPELHIAVPKWDGTQYSLKQNDTQYNLRRVTHLEARCPDIYGRNPPFLPFVVEFPITSKQLRWNCEKSWDQFLEIQFATTDEWLHVNEWQQRSYFAAQTEFEQPQPAVAVNSGTQEDDNDLLQPVLANLFTLSPEDIQQLPRDEQCSICQEVFLQQHEQDDDNGDNDDDSIVRTFCNHLFHQACLANQVRHGTNEEEKYNCAMCRKNIRDTARTSGDN